MGEHKTFEEHMADLPSVGGVAAVDKLYENYLKKKKEEEER